MKKLLSLVALGFALSLGSAYAADAPAAAASADGKTKQQTKMVDCNKQAGEKKLKGDARKKFMSECLKG